MPSSFQTIPFCVITGYYLFINLLLFGAMALDKSRAVSNRRRIPEKNLFLMAILGGGIGGFVGMFTKRHKTKHIDFILAYALTTVLHAFLYVMLMQKFVFLTV